MSFKNPKQELILSRLREPRRFIQAIVGPRQVGKTTAARQALCDSGLPWLYFSSCDALLPGLAWISERFEEAREKLRREGLSELILAIDDIERIEGWSDAVKREWDDDSFHDRGIKLVLICNRCRLLESGHSDSLAGRFEEIRMGHWTFSKMRERFGTTLEQYLYFGGFPGAAAFCSDEDGFRAFVQGSVADAALKDILMHCGVRKPALLEQEFRLGAARSGQILSYTRMLSSLRDAGNTVTLSGYAALLEQSGLLRALGKFSPAGARRRASIPKFQVFDNALKALFTPCSFQSARADPAIWAGIAESAIGAYIANQAFLHHLEASYWREGSDEVDFVLRKNGRVAAIEIMGSARGNARGLVRFARKFGPCRTLAVGDGGISPEEFLATELDGIF